MVQLVIRCWCFRFELSFPDRYRHVTDRNVSFSESRFRFPDRHSRSRYRSRSRIKNMVTEVVRGFSRPFPTVFIPRRDSSTSRLRPTRLQGPLDPDRHRGHCRSRWLSGGSTKHFLCIVVPARAWPSHRRHRQEHHRGHFPSTSAAMFTHHSSRTSCLGRVE
jgi:hypothetical protein